MAPNKGLQQNCKRAPSDPRPSCSQRVSSVSLLLKVQDRLHFIHFISFPSSSLPRPAILFFCSSYLLQDQLIPAAATALPSSYFFSGELALHCIALHCCWTRELSSFLPSSHAFFLQGGGKIKTASFSSMFRSGLPEKLPKLDLHNQIRI